MSMQPDSNAPDLGTWEPPPGILRDYERLWTPTTDAPRVYHVACGLAVLAAAAENRVYLPFGGERIYPNLWMLILGPSSFFRKSTCVSKARKVLGKMQYGDSTKGPLLPDEFSREALLKRLAEKGQGLLTYSEFSGALMQFSRDYMGGTKELLTDLYDCPDHYTRLVGDKTWELKEVCLSILAASQTDWFLEKLKSGDVRGGFLARFAFWPAFHKKRFIAVPPAPDTALSNAVVRGLNSIRGVRGGFEFAPAVEARYTAWLERHERELHSSPRVGELSAFWSRLSIMTLKFAMLLQLSADRELTIGLDAMESAIELTDFLKRSLCFLFDEEFAFTKDMQDRQRVLRRVMQRPGISYRDLMRASSLKKRDLDSMLETLFAEERVEQRIEDKQRLFYPVVGTPQASGVSGGVSKTGTDRIEARFSRVK